MAFDDGYGDNKLNPYGDPFLIPSFITSFKSRPDNEFKTNSNLTYYASSIDGKDYTFGDYASVLDSNPQWVGGENKHSDKRFPLLFKSCLGLMTTKETDNIHKLVMGLPVNSNTDERVNLLKSIVEGKHEMELSLDGEMFFPRNIYVEELIVKPQPFGSLCDVILDDQGQISNKQLAKGFNVIVDVGARTCNVLCVDSLQQIDELTTHSNEGMYTAYFEVSRHLYKELGVNIPDGKLPSVIKAQEINGYDLSPIIQLANENLAYNIKNMVEKMYINSWGFVSSIVFTGGGAEVLKPHLQKMFANRPTLFLDRFSTVRGLRKYGIRKAVQDNMIQVEVGDYDNRH